LRLRGRDSGEVEIPLGDIQKARLDDSEEVET